MAGAARHRGNGRRHLLAPSSGLPDTAAWARLGPQRQGALRAACAEATRGTEAALEQEVREAYAALAQRGVAVTRPDPAPFREALAGWVAESDGQRWPAGLHARIAAL
jgi:TRAP-type C4-dicarboxylate transport system substrate-binding protein